MKKPAKGKPRLDIDLAAISERILNRLLEKVDSTSDAVRGELKANIDALRDCMNAAYELVPQVAYTKPDYLQVGECVTKDSNYFGGSGSGSGPLQLPFKGVYGHYSNQYLDLAYAAGETVRAVAQALSGHQSDGIEAGRYRYAILLYKVDEKQSE